MDRKLLATKKEAQLLTNGKKKPRVEDVGSSSEGGGGDDSEDVESNTVELVQKRVGCSHYKRRAKFVVSSIFLFKKN